MLKLKEKMGDVKKDIKYEMKLINDTLVGVQKSVQEMQELEKERRKLEADLAACQAADKVIDDHCTRTIFVLNNNTAGDDSRQFIGTDNLSFEGHFTATHNHAGPSSVQRLGMFSSVPVGSSTTPASRNREATVTVDDVHIHRLVIGGALPGLSRLPGVRDESDDEASTPLPTAQHHRQD